MERLRRSQLELERGLDQMEQVFLKDSAYVCGPEITIADLLVACELMQAVCAGHSVQASHPKLADWLIRIDKRLRPHFHDVHVMVTELKGLRGSVYQCGSFDTWHYCVLLVEFWPCVWGVSSGKLSFDFCESAAYQLCACMETVFTSTVADCNCSTSTGQNNLAIWGIQYMKAWCNA